MQVSPHGFPAVQCLHQVFPELGGDAGNAVHVGNGASVRVRVAVARVVAVGCGALTGWAAVVFVAVGPLTSALSVCVGVTVLVAVSVGLVVAVGASVGVEKRSGVVVGVGVLAAGAVHPTMKRSKNRRN